MPFFLLHTNMLGIFVSLCVSIAAFALVFGGEVVGLALICFH